MIEETGDLFEAARNADALVITTNGFVKKDGRAVMGRGVAKQAVERWPHLPSYLGELIQRSGNHVYRFGKYNLDGGDLVQLIAFPVKYHWREAADRELIAWSVGELVSMTDEMGWHRVVLPRPGCGNGQLCWERCGDTCLGEPVKNLLVDRLDDRFVVVCNEECEGQHS